MDISQWRKNQAQRSHPRAGRTWRGYRFAAACLGAIVIALIGLTYLHSTGLGLRLPATFETQRGEIRRELLADGSILTLDSETRVLHSAHRGHDVACICAPDGQPMKD